MEFFTKLSDRVSEQISGGDRPDNFGQEAKLNLEFAKSLADENGVSLSKAVQILSKGDRKNFGQEVKQRNPASIR